MRFVSTACRIALVVVLAYAALLVTMAASLPSPVFNPLFSEQGPFEQMSIALWVVLGLAVLWPGPLSPARRISLAALALAFAAREADLHKAYTAMSITKIKFYLSAEVPLLQKLLGGLVLLAAVILILVLARALYRHLRTPGALRQPVTQLLLLPVLLLPATKIIDRFASQLYELFAIRLSTSVGQFVAAIEEGMELAMPLLFLVALLLHRQEGRRG